MRPPHLAYPSTQCAPWPHEASAFGHNALTNESAQLIRTHVATLLADSRRAITPLTIEKMFARKSCVLLRASNGRLLVDPLDTPFLSGNIEIASCHPSKLSKACAVVHSAHAFRASQRGCPVDPAGHCRTHMAGILPDTAGREVVRQCPAVVRQLPRPAEPRSRRKPT